LPRSARRGVRRTPVGAARARAVRLRRDRHRALGGRLRRRRAPREGRRRLPERDQGDRRRGQGLEAVTRIGQVGLGYWGGNLARNVDELADLCWLCDTDAARQDQARRRFPGARVTGSYDEMLGDPELEAVVIATPVPTHCALARQALETGKDVFVEKR